MNNDKQHNINEKDEHNFSNVKVKYSKSKDDVWSQLEEKMDFTEVEAPKQTKVINMNWRKWSLAASLALIFGAIAFMKFFTTSIVLAPNESIVVTLPDNSTVTLRGGSELSYTPYWWFVDRSLQFEGEAFFDVEKGSSFTVKSDNGVTQVLGTSFSIYANDENYEVFCKTGKVKVTTTNDEQLIAPGMLAHLVNEGKLLVEDGLDPLEILDWQNNQFVFNNTALKKVINEVERECNISIELQVFDDSKYYFSGKFERDKNINILLESIAFSLDLQFKEVSNTKFVLQE